MNQFTPVCAIRVTTQKDYADAIFLAAAARMRGDKARLKKLEEEMRCFENEKPAGADKVLNAFVIK